MGKMKEWLMDMEEDATKLSANQFKIRHGEEHIYIWEEVNGPEFPDDTNCLDHDRKVLLDVLKKLFKVKYHPSLNKLSYGETRRIHSAIKKVGA